MHPASLRGAARDRQCREAGCGDAAASGARGGGWAVPRTEGCEPSSQSADEPRCAQADGGQSARRPRSAHARRLKSCGLRMPTGASRDGGSAKPTGARNTLSPKAANPSAGESTKQAGSTTACGTPGETPVNPKGLRAFVLPTTASRAGKGVHRAPGVPRVLFGGQGMQRMPASPRRQQQGRSRMSDGNRTKSAAGVSTFTAFPDFASLHPGDGLDSFQTRTVHEENPWPHLPSFACMPTTPC